MQTQDEIIRRVDEIEQRLKSITQPPWTAVFNMHSVSESDYDYSVVSENPVFKNSRVLFLTVAGVTFDEIPYSILNGDIDQLEAKRNTQFVACAPDDISYLCQHLRLTLSTIEHLQQRLDRTNWKLLKKCQ